MDDGQERQRCAEIMNERDSVFVFGSNLAGTHGAGAARFAEKHYGARHSIGLGRVGRSYAIPTKRVWYGPALPLDQIQGYVDEFLVYARARPTTIFAVTRIGCGYAGYTDADIAPMFADAPPNCILPDGWRK